MHILVQSSVIALRLPVDGIFIIYLIGYIYTRIAFCYYAAISVSDPAPQKSTTYSNANTGM